MLDGLETLFAQNLHTAANVILKALNNRRFIYFVTLKLDYSVLKEQEKKQQEENGKNYSKIISIIQFSKLSFNLLDIFTFV